VTRLSVAAALLDAEPSSVARFLGATRRMGLERDDEVVLALTPAPGRSSAELLALADPAREHVLVCDPPQSLTLLWGRAMAEASGSHVAVLDARDAPEPGWVAAWSSAPRGAIVCGPVAPGSLANLTSWAAYLSEYGQFCPPVDKSTLEEVPGNNVVFPRDLLPPPEELRERGFWKTFHLARLQSSSKAPVIEPLNELAVSYERTYTSSYYFARRYAHGRCYGGSRLSEPGAPPRLACLAFTVALPALRTLRVLRRIARKPALARRFVAAAVPLVLGEVTWALGEGVGYAVGAGDTCANLR
jgi:hypothetical protein